MFLLDTNVVSELRKAGKANPGVLQWCEGVDPERLYLSSVTILELETGALLLARRDKAQAKVIAAWIEQRILPAFSDRILPVDTAVARACASYHVPNPLPYRDSLIAATAAVHRLTIVTRNRGDFEQMFADVLDPWT